MKPPAVVDAPQISAEKVAAFRLARHHLARKAPASQLPRVAGDMAGVQAQLMSAAQMSLWSRTRGLRLEDVERALWQDRTLVKVWCMRGTVHLVPSHDFAVFVRGSAGRAERSTAWMIRAGLPVDRIERFVEAAQRALDRPLTRKELAERVSDSLGVSMRSKGGRGWGGPANAPGFEVGDSIVSIGGILFLACMRGIACAGPNRGNEATFVRPDVWLADWREMSQEKAEDDLLRRYLRAHGPATVGDFAMWTYLTAADARGVWSRLEKDLTPVNVDGRTAWVLRADLPSLRRARLDRPTVRLLPYFDSFLLGLKDKSHLVDAAHYKRVFRPEGWLSPVVLIDGRVAGMWSVDRKRRRLGIRVEAFKALRAADRTSIRDEAEDLRRFLDAPEVAVAFA
jgi:uncharacterized protein YcaQ